MMIKSFKKHLTGFTLVELLVVVAILALLMSIVIITINPSEILKKTRDSRRITDLSSLEKAFLVFQATKSAASLGTYQKVYVSLPAANSDCSDLHLPDLPSGYSYKCSTSQDFRKTDGTGWIPVNINSLDIGSPISSLPVDPTNSYAQDTTSRNDWFYTYTVSNDSQSFEVNAKLESNYYGFKDRDGFPLKDAASNDAPVADGGDSGLYEKGPNLTLMPDSGGLCPTGMVWVPQPARMCIDKYEASYAASGTKTDGTACTSNCPLSLYNAPPWTSVQAPAPSQNTAITYCQNMGKVLPTDFEWWVAASGTPDQYNSSPTAGTEPCQIWNTGSWPDYSARKPSGSLWAQSNGWGASQTAAIKTGTATNCKSTVGAMDMIGNVWEWTNNTLTCDGALCTYSGITLPAANYITSINNEGIPLTSGSANTAFNYDYLWENTAANTYAFLRCASWSNGEAAGRFSLYVFFVPGNASSKFGFRCVLR